MKNSRLVVITIFSITLIVSLAYFFFSSYNSSKSSVTSNSNSKIEKTDKQTQNDQTSKNDSSQSSYVRYSLDALESSSSKRRVLFFYANWCPTCRPTDENLNANLSKIPKDVSVIRVNYNDSDTDQEEKDLAKKYAITYQHTFVQIDQNGNEVTKWNGGKIDELLKNII